MSIGGTLAEARHREGLTVAEVSAHTRIREALIRAIEHDEFSACGGDFYARGHIRAIAAVVGADARALISEYDAAAPADGPATVDDLRGEPSPFSPRSPRSLGSPGSPGSPRSPGPPRHRRRRSWLVPVGMLLFLALIGYLAIRLTPGPGGAQPSAASPTRTAARSPAASGGSRSGQRHATAASQAARPAQTPSPVELTPVSAVAFGPAGTSDGDNPQNASLALSGNPGTPWQTDWYTTARFGNLQAGTGLLLDLGRTVLASTVTIQLGSTPGADLQVRAGTAPADLHVMASATDAGGTVRLSLAAQPQIRYLLIWFTLLPPDPAGTYQADVSSVTVTGSPA